MFESIIRYYFIFDGFKLHKWNILSIFFCSLLFYLTLKSWDSYVCMHSELRRSYVVACSCISFLSLLYGVPVNLSRQSSPRLCIYPTVGKHWGFLVMGYVFFFAITNNTGITDVGVIELSSFCSLIGAKCYFALIFSNNWCFWKSLRMLFICTIFFPIIFWGDFCLFHIDL